MNTPETDLDAATITGPEVPVLIVEDNAQNALVLRKILEGVFGYKNITWVDDNEKAYALITAEPEKHRLLFIDYNLPSGEYGTELIEKLRNENLMAHKIAFIITADPTLENMKKAQSAGALGVVAKPFNREDLKAQLELAERVIKEESTPSF